MNKIKEGYKQTELGLIPNDWEIKKLLEVINLMTDYVANGSFESLKNNVLVTDFENYAVYVRLVDLRKGLGHNEQKYVDKKSYDFLKKSNLNNNDILISNIGANVGESFIMPTINKPSTIAPNMIVVKNNDNYINYKFLYYYLKSELGLNELIKIVSGSGHPKINKTDLKTIKIIIPPLEEQKKIACILTTWDNAIEKTEKLIENKNKLKKALMQQLLTGKKRFKDFIKSNEYKKTELGLIPVDWEIEKIEKILIELKSGLSRRLSDQNIGIPVIRSNNIVDSGVSFSDLKYWYINDPQGANTSEYILKNGDILVNFINSSAQIGKCSKFINNLGIDFIYTTNLLRLRLIKDIDIDYILYNTKTKNYFEFIKSITKPAVNQASFTTKEFKNFILSLPSLEEQKKIASVLTSCDKEIELLEKKLNTLKNQKRGLMQKLLTGQIRVKIDI